MLIILCFLSFFVTALLFFFLRKVLRKIKIKGNLLNFYDSYLLLICFIISFIFTFGIYFTHLKISRDNYNIRNFDSVISALESYKNKNQKYPKSISDIYLGFTIKDYWNQTIIYEPIDMRFGYKLRSIGADGVIDTEDDIVFIRQDSIHY